MFTVRQTSYILDYVSILHCFALIKEDCIPSTLKVSTNSGVHTYAFAYNIGKTYFVSAARMTPISKHFELKYQFFRDSVTNRGTI